MVERVVINASPLIFFSRGSHLDILKEFSDRIVVPEPVALEIQAKGAQDITVKALSEPWLEIVQSVHIPEVILNWGLGPGESSVIAYAYENVGFETIIDDLAGRKCAISLDIPVRGTLGIILVSKIQGNIPRARPVIEDMIRGGLYLSQTVIDEALKRVGE